RRALVVAERKAAGGEVGLAIARRVEALCLDRRVRRDPAVERRDAVAAFNPPAERLRVEARGEMVAGKGEAVGRHPVIGEGERGGRTAPPHCGGAVEPGWGRTALPAPHPRRETPLGPAAGKRNPAGGAGGGAMAGPGRAPRRARGKIVVSYHGRIAGRAVRA